LVVRKNISLSLVRAGVGFSMGLGVLLLSGCGAERSDKDAAPIVSHKLGDPSSYAMQDEEGFSGSNLDFDGSENLSPEARDELGMLKNKVYFGFDRFKVSGNNKSIVDKNAAFLSKHHDVPVMLTGNTDPRGSSSYNLHLGQNRADSVKSMLMKEGVSEKQICTVSYGELRPAATVDGSSGDWVKAYELDRRVEFVYGQKCEGEAVSVA
jgi:peptidoglycan-associated lipoprotein